MSSLIYYQLLSLLKKDDKHISVAYLKPDIGGGDVFKIVLAYHITIKYKGIAFIGTARENVEV